ncbi:hypothetical protein [Streptococcus halichoeri]|uniref:hypothetical protein n=1 Tax=Streptococcus halichoeri TaxID=254785 RepID=UPI001357DFE2|nr:hypothetical protein [Streptococcus halichoeri]
MWDLKVLYSNDRQWKESIADLNQTIDKLSQFEFGADTLELDFSRIEHYSKNLDRLYTYGLLRREEEPSNKDIQRYIGQIRNLYQVFNSKIEAFKDLFFDKDNIIDIMNKNEKLKVYKAFFQQKVNNSVRMGDVEIEKLYKKISPKDEYISWYSSFESIGKFKRNNSEERLTEENILKHLMMENQQHRKKAYESVETFLKQNSDSASFFLNTHYQLRNFSAKRSGFSHAYDMFVFNNIFNQNSSDYFFQKNVIESVIGLHNEILQRKIKRNHLKSFTYSDIYYVKNNSKFEMSFDKAIDIILKSFKAQGEKFYGALKMAVKNDWIFYEQEQSKHAGQRSINCFEAHPFITVNWNNDFHNLFDLVHEISGAVSQWYAGQNGMFLYSELSILKTEFMSFLGTMYLIDYLMDNIKTSNERNIIFDTVDNFIRESLIVPFAHSVIEHDLYKKANEQQLQSDDISNIWYDVISKFHHVQKFEDMPINRFNWVRHEHFYLDGYDFSYILAFILAYKFHEQNKKLDLIVELLNEGERISDEDFFNRLFGEIPSYDELLISCVKDIKRRYYEKNFYL